MTTQEKINAIREKCIAVNPEIVELKVACQVELESKDERYQKATILRQLSDDSFECEWGSFGPSFITKILGRPIRLADVLFAIKVKIESGCPVFVPEGMHVGVLRGDPKRNILEWFFECWRLNRDDLTLQDPSTIDFIHQILCGV